MTEAPAQWNGVPPEPSKDGWHWIDDSVLMWNSEQQQWHYLDMLLPPEDVPGEKYLGPCLTPAEVAERERAAELRGFEAAIEWLPNVKTTEGYGANPFLAREYQESMRAELARRRERQQIVQEAACSERTLEGYIDSTEQALAQRWEGP